VLEVLEWHELDNVTVHEFLVFLRVQWLVIGIKNVHRGEVGFTYSNNDDAERQGASPHNLIDCLLHVVDDSVGDDQKNNVLLVSLGHFKSFCHVVDHAYYFIEVSWPIEVCILE